MPTVSALFGVDASCERGKCCIRMCHMSYTRARAILHGRSTQHLLKLARIQASLLSRGCDPLATAPSSRVYRHASTISIVSDFQQESFTSRPPPWNATPDVGRCRVTAVQKQPFPDDTWAAFGIRSTFSREK